MRKFLLIFSIFILSVPSFATHIIGGELQYQHLGGASYQITLKMYRDCDPSSADFTSTASVIVDEGDGTSYTTFTLPMLGRSVLNPPIDTCAFDPGICVEEAIYSSVVNLPPGAGGYHLYVTLCCRNGSILNIDTPLSARETFYAYVPDNNAILTNSSPIISNFPPVYVCNMEDLSLDFGATDVDGDSLVYSFYTPYDGFNGSGVTYSAATPPDNFQASTVTWLAGFTANSPLDPAAAPGLSIDPSTGFITGSPVMVGQFVVGVMVDEYRDGVLIGRVTRDFQFNVVDCPPAQEAAIGPTDGCSGTSIDFVNASDAGASDFLWDFDTSTPNTVATDTSDLFEPSHTYPAIGTYEVMLIAQKGTNCADTAYYTLNVSGVTPDFTMTDTVCVNESFTCTDLSTTLSGTITAWEWDFGDGNTSTLQNPSHSYNSGGDFDVQLIVTSDQGCSDTITQSIYSRTPPAAGITPMPGCNGLTVDFMSSSDASASGFWWSFGTGFPADTSDLENPTFTYSSYGSYDVDLVTQKGTVCADTTTYTILLTQLIPDFEDLDTVCVNSIIDFVDLSSVSSGALTTWDWDFGDGGNGTAQNPSHGYSASGDYDIQLTVTSDLGCVDSITKPLYVETSPVATIGAVDACSGVNITFDNLSDPNATDFWWDFGTGNPADTSVVFEPTFTYPSFGTYTVTLMAQRGSDCETQDTYVLNISELTADFNMVDSTCANTTVNFTDQTASAATVNSWQWDFGDASTSVNQNETHTYNSAGDYTVQLIVETSVGCSDTIQKNIFIQGEVVSNAGLDTAVCVASPSLQLSGLITNAGGGIWTGNGGVFTPSNTQLNATYNPSIAEINAGETELILTSTSNGYCAVDEDTIHIYYLADPVVDAGLNQDVCADSVYMDLQADVQNAFAIQWTTSGTGVIADDTQDTTTYTPSTADVTAGEVILYIETFNNSGCPNDQDSLIIQFNAAPTVSVTAVDTTCSGDDVYLQSNSTTGNGWWETFGDGTFAPSDTGSVTFYSTGTTDLASGEVTIVFHSLDNGGCKTVYDTTLVRIIPSPIGAFTATEMCFGETTDFTDQSTAVEPITNWNWTFESTQNSVVQNPTHTFSSPGLHAVELVVTSLNGCKDTLVQNVQVYYLPEVGFVSPEPCDYGAVFLDTTQVTDTTAIAWTWDFGDGNSSTEQNPVHSFNPDGIYDISLTVTTANGCQSTVTVPTLIYPDPTAEFSFNPSPAQVEENVQFTDESTSPNGTIVYWLWDFDNGSVDSIQNPTQAYDDGGGYEVELLVIDSEGCRDTVVHQVIVLYGPDAPTAFSPNGDGSNDYFMILGGEFESLDFKVYNNWGEIIYQTTDLNDLGWDGTYKGEPQPIGVYVFTAVVTLIDGSQVELHGDVSLIR